MTNVRALPLLLLLSLATGCNAFVARHGRALPLFACKAADSPATASTHSAIRTFGEGDTAHPDLLADDVSIKIRRDDILRSGLAAFASTVLATTSVPSSAAAASSPFEGTYSDPINHPGGKRTIKILDGAPASGDYRLAEVKGGGGRGEPKDYTLPAVVVGDRAIIIDFSPKGGPRDFTGVPEKDGSIKFLRDGNRWPRLE